jgi:hypothetical protein
MRIDDHEDLVFALATYAKVAKPDVGQGGRPKRASFGGKHLERFSLRFPGHSVGTVGYLKQFIMDLLLRALWPWRTCFIYCYPGRGSRKCPLFHLIRKNAMIRK